jgi:hypothetical protein
LMQPHRNCRGAFRFALNSRRELAQGIKRPEDHKTAPNEARPTKPPRVG